MKFANWRLKRFVITGKSVRNLRLTLKQRLFVLVLIRDSCVDLYRSLWLTSRSLRPRSFFLIKACFWRSNGLNRKSTTQSRKKLAGSGGRVLKRTFTVLPFLLRPNCLLKKRPLIADLRLSSRWVILRLIRGSSILGLQKSFLTGHPYLYRRCFVPEQ